MFKKIKTKISKFSCWAQDVIHISNRLGALNEDLDEVACEVDDLTSSASLDDLEQRINDLEYEQEEVKNLIDDIPSTEDLENKMEDLSSRVDEMDDDLSHKIEELTSSFESLAGRIIRLEERMLLKP